MLTYGSPPFKQVKLMGATFNQVYQNIYNQLDLHHQTKIQQAKDKFEKEKQAEKNDNTSYEYYKRY